MKEEKLIIEPQSVNSQPTDNDSKQIQDGVNEIVAILFEHWLEQRLKARGEKSSNQPDAPDTS